MSGPIQRNWLLAGLGDRDMLMEQYLQYLRMILNMLSGKQRIC